MSKTAEEILNKHFEQSVPTNTPMWDSAVNAANEFAAQEVEAYKERLKIELSIRSDYMHPDHVIKLIDTVK